MATPGIWSKQAVIGALDATKGLVSDDKRLMAAVLTTRGGAFRDRNALADAEDCARKALAVNPDNTRHAYYLLGAIYYQRGNPEDGDKCFQKAGISPDERDRQVRDAFARAGRAEKLEVARYLLHKDPEKYEWAEYYLHSDSTGSVPNQ
jgi:tetratricopeptide (TPR) repeat protein